MAKYESSPFGVIKGKMAGQVGFTWKGVKATRSYVVPANPQTVGQTSNRNKFKAVSAVGSALNYALLVPATYPRPKQKSPYNAFVSINTKIQDSDVIDFSTIEATSGSYQGVEVNSATLATGVVTVSISPNDTLDTSPQDYVFVGVLNTTLMQAVGGAGVRGETDGSITVDVPDSWGESDSLVVYVSTVDTLKSKNSTSVYMAVS